MNGLLIWWTLLSPPALALDGNDYLYLTLSDGLRVKGWYYGVQGEALTVSGDNRLVEVYLPSVASVVRNGQTWPLADFQKEVEAERSKVDAWLANPPPHPPGWVVGTGAMICCGLGQAALGDGKGFARYAIADAVFVGTATWAVLDGPGWGLALPVGGLVVLFHGYAASEAIHETQKRRARLGLRPPVRADSALPRTSASSGLTEVHGDE